MLLPALTAAKNRATRITCLNNLKQMGISLFIYGGDFGDQLAPASYTPSGKNTGNNCWMTYLLYPTGGANGNLVNTTTTAPLNHGLFYSTKSVSSGKSFYCPGVNDTLPAPRRFTFADNSANGVWPAYCVDTSFSGDCRSSYMYFPQSAIFATLTPPDPTPNNPTYGYKSATKLTQLSATRIAMTDLIYDWPSIPHRSGNNSEALNVVWGDGHANVCTTKAVFNLGLPVWGSNPTGAAGGNDAADNEGQFLKIIGLLQP